LEQHFFGTLCHKIVSLDKSIRFVGIADEDGILLGASERKGLKALLTAEQRAEYAITAATRQYTRLRWQSHLGKIHYASSHYAKLIRATIPVTDANNELHYVMLLSFDSNTQNLHQIMTRKIIPEVEKIASTLLDEKKQRSRKR
jgi:hypothetical protein